MSSWLEKPRGMTGSQQPRFGRNVEDPSPAADYSYQFLLNALRSKAPGQWSSNLMEQSRHFTSAIYLGVNTKAHQMASADWVVNEMDPDEPDAKHPLHHTDPACMLISEPNPDDCLEDFAYQCVQQLELTGFCLIWVPDADMRGAKADGFPRMGERWIPDEMYVIPTATCFPIPQSHGYEQGAYRILPLYPYGPFSTLPSFQSAAGAVIPAEQIIRIKHHHPLLRYDAYAVLTAMKLQIDTVEMIDRSRFSTQERGIDPSVVMNFDPAKFNPNEADLARLRTQLMSLYAGPQNVGKILFNPYGTETTILSTAPKDMAWQEGWSQLMEFVLAAVNVPKPVAGLLDTTSYAQLYASMKQFYMMSLDPLARKFQARLNRFLIRPSFGDDIMLSITPRKITDDEIEERKLQADMANGIRRLNEIRKLRDLPLIPGPEGEAFVGKHPAAPAGPPGGMPGGGGGVGGGPGAPRRAVGGVPGQPGGPGGPGGQPRAPGEPGRAEPETEAARPTNDAGAGSLGPRAGRSQALRDALGNRGFFPHHEARDLWDGYDRDNFGRRFFGGNGNGHGKSQVATIQEVAPPVINVTANITPLPPAVPKRRRSKTKITARDQQGNVQEFEKDEFDIPE